MERVGRVESYKTSALSLASIHPVAENLLSLGSSTELAQDAPEAHNEYLVSYDGAQLARSLRRASDTVPRALV